MKTVVAAGASTGIGIGCVELLTTRYVVTPDPIRNFLTTCLPGAAVGRMVARRIGLMRKN